MQPCFSLNPFPPKHGLKHVLTVAELDPNNDVTRATLALFLCNVSDAARLSVHGILCNVWDASLRASSVVRDRDIKWTTKDVCVFGNHLFNSHNTQDRAIHFSSYSVYADSVVQ